MTEKITAKNVTHLYPIAKVIDVHDGDTIRLLIDQGFNELAREWIRLKDVRAPENKEGEPAVIAKGVLQQWLDLYAPDGYVSVTTYQVETEAKEIREEMTFIRYVGTVMGQSIVEDVPVHVTLNDWQRNHGYINQGN